MKFIKFNPELIEFELDLNIYSFEVIHKCFYWYCSDFVVEIKNGDTGKAIIRLKPKTVFSDPKNLEDLKVKISDDLIDFKTRDTVSKETQNIRDLLIAKAFSHSDEFDQPPPGDYRN